jgi:hypothetical protein
MFDYIISNKPSEYKMKYFTYYLWLSTVPHVIRAESQDWKQIKFKIDTQNF